MIHQMGLYDEYFKAMKDGKKTVEVRLNDEKRRKIKVGDIIEFIRVPEQAASIFMEVTELRTYATFREMYHDIPFEALDGEGWTVEEMLKGTYEIYSPAQEKQWGTLAIGVKRR